jgi:hypothetical protein
MRASRVGVVLSLIAAGIVGFACASGSTGRSAGSVDQSLMTREQMEDGRFLNVFDAVIAVHSNWMRVRGPTSLDSSKDARTGLARDVVKVYLDNTFLGDTSKLHQIPVSSILWVRHFDGVTATARWGLDHGSGVIFVSTHAAGVDLPSKPNTP